ELLPDGVGARLGVDLDTGVATGPDERLDLLETRLQDDEARTDGRLGGGRQALVQTPEGGVEAAGHGSRHLADATRNAADDVADPVEEPALALLLKADVGDLLHDRIGRLDPLRRQSQDLPGRHVRI